MNLFETFIKIGVDSSEVGSKVDSLKSDMFSLGDAIKANLISDAIKSGITFVIDGLEKMGKAVLGFGKDSLDAAVDFESAFAGVKKTVDATEEEYGQLSDWIKKASTDMAASQGEIAGAMEVAGQLGISGVDNLEKFTETMVMLGTSTNLSSEEAATALARIVNITGESTEDIDKLGAVVVALGNNFATNESEITNMATRLASTGTISGLTTKEIFALSTAMSSVGIQAEAGGTAMTQTLTALSQAVSGATGDEKELAKAQDKVDKATEALTKAQEKYNKAMAESGEDSSKAKIALNNLEKAQITYNAAVKKYGEDSDQAKKALQGVENAQIKYDDVLSKSSDKVKEAAKNVEKAEQDLATAQQNLENASGGASDKLTLIAQVSKMSAEQFAETWKNDPMQAITAFIAGLGDLESTGMDVNQVLDTLSMDGIRQGNMLKSLSLATEQLTAAQEVANSAYEENTALTDEAGKRYETAASQLAMVENAFKNIQIAIGEGMSPTFVEFLGIVKEGLISMEEAFGEDGFQGLFDKFGEMIEGILGFVEEKMPEITQVATTIIEGIATGLGEHIDDIVGAAENIAGSIITYFDEHLEDIGAVGGKIISSIVNFFGEHIDELASIGSRIIEYITKSLSDMAAQIGSYDWKGAAAELANNLRSSIAGEGEPTLISAAADLVSNLASGLGAAAPELIPAAIDLMLSFANDLIEQIPMLISSAADLIIGLTEGLTNPESLTNILNTAINLIMALADGLIEALPKLIEAAPTIVGNLVEAIEKNAPHLFVAALKLIMKLYTGLLDAIPELIKAVPEIIASLVAGLIEGTAEIIPAADELMNAFHDEILSFDFIGWGVDMVTSFIDGIKSGIGDIGDAANFAAQTIADFLGFSEPEKGPLSNFHTFAPDMMDLFAKGIKDNTDEVRKQIEESFDFDDLIKDQEFDFSSNIEGKFTGHGTNEKQADDTTGGFVQNLTINAPKELSPSEIARQTRNANREFVLSVRMA